MATYIFMIASSLIFAFMADIENKNKIKYIYGKMLINILLFLSILPPLFVGAFRYQIGVDYKVYTNLQIPLVLKNWDPNFKVVEPGSQLLIKLGNELSKILSLNFINQYQMVFICIQCVYIVFLFLTIKNNKKNYCITLFIFYCSMFFFSSLNLMRQSLGCIVFLYSIKFINKNKIKYFILNIIGTTFHSISIVYIFAYFIKYIKKIYWQTLYIPIIVIPLANFIRMIIEQITISLGLDYSQYFGSIMDTGNSSLSLVFLHYSLLIIIYFGSKKVKDDNIEIIKKINFFYYCQVITVSLAAVASSLPNAYRLISLFSYVSIVSIPFILSIQKNKKNRFFILISVILVYLIFFLYNVIILKSNEFFPYKSIFNT